MSDPQQQFTNLPKGLIGVSGLGFSAQGSAALNAALTIGAGDDTGAPSTTAAISLAKQLREFTPEFEGDDELTRIFEASNAEQRLQILRERQEQAFNFLSDASFEAQFIAPIEELLIDANSKTARAFDSVIKNIPLSPELLAEQGQESITRVQSGLFNTVQKQDQIFKSFDEQFALAGIDPALTTEQKEAFKRVLVRTGASSASTEIIDFLSGFRPGGFKTSSAIDTLSRRRGVLEERVSIGGFLVDRREEDRQGIRLLERMIETLVENARTQKEQLDAQKEDWPQAPTTRAD